LITLGEGWHNNHHRFPGAARQGIFWWEIDITYYALRMMETVGLVSDLHKHPQEAKQPPHKSSPPNEFESEKQEIAV
jgi:stearoyl-CoA desaturase (delta-9 desaturase)